MSIEQVCDHVAECPDDIRDVYGFVKWGNKNPYMVVGNWGSPFNEFTIVIGRPGQEDAAPTDMRCLIFTKDNNVYEAWLEGTKTHAWFFIQGLASFLSNNDPCLEPGALKKLGFQLEE